MRFVTPVRLRIYLAAICGAAWVGFVLSLLVADGVDTVASGRLGGDLPAFYAAGQLVLDGALDQVWDWDVQARLQAPLVGAGGIIPFAYPPLVAVIYAPLAALPFTGAYVVHALIMASLVVVSVLGIVRLMPGLAPWRTEALLASLSFFPLFRAVTGGQLTAAYLALLVWALVLLHDRPWAAGVLVGLLWLKPQFALPLTGLLLLDKRWRPLLSTAATLAAWWVLNAGVAGGDWLRSWVVDGLIPIDEANTALGPVQTASLVGALRTFDGWMPQAIAGVMVVTFAAAMIWSWHRRPDPAFRLAIVCVGTILIAPHANWYDVGLLLPVFALVADRGHRTSILPLLTVYVVSWLVTSVPIALLISTSALALLIWVDRRQGDGQTSSGAVSAGAVAEGGASRSSAVNTEPA